MKLKNRRILYTHGIILALSFTGMLVRWKLLFPELEMRFHLISFAVSTVVMSLMWEAMRGIHIFLNRTYPFERNVTIRIALQLFLGMTLMLVTRFFIMEYAVVHSPFKIDKMFRVSVFAADFFITLSLNLGHISAHFFTRWKESILRAERLEKEKSMVQFDNLKNQLNPHFLFNSLTSLNSLIFEDKELASKFLQHLSKVYRYVLQNKEKEAVPVRTEVDFIQNFIFLLQTRFNHYLTITFDIKEEDMEKGIVPVTLQNLLENAVKHNIINESNPLHISIYSENDYLVVKNNLQKKKIVETSNRQGLENLESLYHFLSDRSVLIEEDENYFSVKIPLL